MFLSWKSVSRSIHDEHPELSEIQGGDVCTSPTVWRKSLILTCKGFNVIDSNGDLVYRVDSYMGGRPKNSFLWTAQGSPSSLCDVARLVDTWLVYGGEAGEICTSEQPIFHVKKSMKILHGEPNVLAYVYRGSRDKRYAYMIEGSYSQRSCMVVDDRKSVVAEIRRKDVLNGCISLGLEVFLLIVQAGFDPVFAMALCWIKWFHRFCPAPQINPL
ncbi:Detected protein of unknown function [Hibiscus syriacus]|uniref:Uncharacterized protein n=1 Tax=Hibiscus syriacus TaxID=106335 RepID=A0A6A3B1I3_HIBSY|nr:Detected protein of unknown function [Hibiscus syriacus]